MKKTTPIAICLSFLCLVNLAWGEIDPTETKRLGENGNAESQLILGNIYVAGEGVPKNYIKAGKWFRKAADQGHAKAQVNIGGMYDSALGVSQNSAEAMKWYRKAADQGHDCAQYNLGVMYNKGKGDHKNFIKAYVWLSIALEKVNENAKNNLEILSPKMTPQQISQAQNETAELWKKIRVQKNKIF